MKCQGILVEFLLAMAPEVYGPYMVYEGGVKMVYLQVLRGLYGMLSHSCYGTVNSIPTQLKFFKF